MSDAFELAWSVLKADPSMNIREVSSSSRQWDRNPNMATMNPIIARLIRERNEATGRTYPNVQRPQGIERLESAYAPHGEYPGRVGHNIYFPKESYEEAVRADQAKNIAAGVEPGEQFRGDYVVRPGGMGDPLHRGSERARRLGDTGQVTNPVHFPYGGRRGASPANVQPGSPMDRMYEYAPMMRNLPENMQPDWMEGFRE